MIPDTLRTTLGTHSRHQPSAQKRTKLVRSRKNRKRVKTKDLVRKTWGIAVLFGALIEPSARESANCTNQCKQTRLEMPTRILSARAVYVGRSYLTVISEFEPACVPSGVSRRREPPSDKTTTNPPRRIPMTPRGRPTTPDHISNNSDLIQRLQGIYLCRPYSVCFG